VDVMMRSVSEPLKILGVIAEEISQPPNDGSRGSALYAVPIRLSRQPSPLEADLLDQVWDRPPQYTPRHRPGILHIVGDRMVLDGTTIEEVRDVHATTLRLVVDQVNQLAAAQQAEAHRRQQADRARARQHADHVKQVADEVNFGA
jgi:hypothetical protein